MTVVNDHTGILYVSDGSPDATWNGGFGLQVPVVVTYSFVEGADIGPWEATAPYANDGYASMTAAQRANFLDVLAIFEQVAGVVFVEVSSGAAMINAMTTSGSAWGGWASVSNSSSEYGVVSGELVVDNEGDFDEGSYAFLTMLHELGHAMGLSHPFDGNVTLDTTIDDLAHTVMTYNLPPLPEYPTTLGTLDVAALQYLYGSASLVAGWVTSFYEGVLTVTGSERGDSILGVSGQNVLTGADGADHLYGRQAADTLDGGDGNDNLDGGAGDDTLDGGDGNDNLDGGAGDDTLTGGSGNDTLAGGVGSDTFVFAMGFGQDRIADFTTIDFIDISAIASMNSWDSLLVMMSQSAFGVSITNLEGTILLAGVTQSALSAANFLFAKGGGVVTGLTLVGTAGADNLIGGMGNDTINGLAGNDNIVGLAGDDTLDGGTGVDTAIYSGSQTSYTLTLSPTSTLIEDRNVSGNGTDHLINIELLDFDTEAFPFDFNLGQFGGPTGLSQEAFESFIELYIAYFNRAPDAVGLNFWGTAFATGTTLAEMATEFINQDETRVTYPDGTSNDAFARSVYDNVLGRTPDDAGVGFWVGLLNSDEVSRDQFILEVLRGAKSELKPELGQGFVDQQIADQAYLSNKIDIGAYFAVHKGMSDVGNASAAMALFDGSELSIDAAVAAIDAYYAEALDPSDGEFLMPLVGVLDNPFEMSSA